MKSETVYIILIFSLIAVILILIRSIYRTSNEFNQFVKAITYRDFSRHYNLKGNPGMRKMRKGFNIIQDTFRTISKEKETQYHYLETILEMVDTGILAYETETGRIIRMNDGLKNLLEIPYLKTIESLKKRDMNLYKRLQELQPGDSSIVSVEHKKQNVKVVLSATVFLTDNTPHKLVVFQNVNEVLDETESKAWQKLLSVMTHEIMNSVAPISSLADTLKNRIKEIPHVDSDKISDLAVGIETIRNRSEGLLRFAEVYRNLYKVTSGKFTSVRVSDIFGNIHRLMKPKLDQLNITTEIVMKEPLQQIKADQGLIEQVMINLILNAIDAVKDNPDPRIRISSSSDNDNRPIIRITDNGTGIPDELLDRIFIPFFSTKKNGNGIGLPLCKQIMQLHKGSISVQTVVNEGTAILLRF